MSSARQANVLAIVGPTASGKSRLGMEIAQSVGGEIIGADSRQVYRHMDIGTAKPPLDDRQRIRHHLIDIIDPSDDYSVALYVRQAREAIEDVLERGSVPIVVGGTGQYVWALLEGWNVPEVSPDPSLRAQLQERLNRSGLADLVGELEKTAPSAAERIDLANPRRVIRALELPFRPLAANRRLQHERRHPFSRRLSGFTWTVRGCTTVLTPAWMPCSRPGG